MRLECRGTRCSLSAEGGRQRWTLFLSGGGGADGSQPPGGIQARAPHGNDSDSSQPSLNRSRRDGAGAARRLPPTHRSPASLGLRPLQSASHRDGFPHRGVCLSGPFLAPFLPKPQFPFWETEQ